MPKIYNKKSNNRTNNRSNNRSNNKPEYFLPTSKLKKLQRKYCKCIMMVRPNLKTITKRYGKGKGNGKVKVNDKANSRYSGKSKRSSKGKINSNENSNKSTRNVPYGLCYSSIRKKMGMHKTKKQRQKFHMMLKPNDTNCTMNYNYREFTLTQVQHLAKEFKIKTKYYSQKGGKYKNYAKSTLTSMIVSDYLKKQEKAKKGKKSKISNNVK